LFTRQVQDKSIYVLVYINDLLAIGDDMGGIAILNQDLH